ncbi:MAG TPA: elongation factor G [Burkholderiales bacterium]|nr:elongation factor G [Burkholderiales bacterium]
MPKFSPEAIRTIALTGHGGSGKTTLAEALLARAGAIASIGTVEKGTTVCDFDPIEKQFQHSLNAAVVHLQHKDTRIHLIDTPGLPDFIGRAIGGLPAVDTAAIVVNAQNGVEMITGRMMQWARKRDLCRMIIVNKIDAENVDLPGVLAKIQAAFGRECLPINLPADGGKRVVDCFFNPAGAADFSSVEAAHSALVDQVVEVDEELMAQYLEKGEVAPEALHAPFEKALREGHLVPVCFVSARSGAGVAELLDIIVKLLPNPTEGNAPQLVKGAGDKAQPVRAEPDPKKHVIAHVFKVMIDPYVGKVGVFRVHQGTITKDSQLFIGEGRKAFKVGHAYLLQGKDFVETDALVPGDIGAVAKVDEIYFDAVLHDSHDEDQLRLVPLEFPTPMHSLAIEPKRRGDEQKISDALHKLSAEDPTFKVEHNATLNQTLISGLGDLHMRYILERMTKQYNVEVSTKPPRIPYRETITARAEGHHRHKKQTGGAGQFGEVFLKVEPLKRGSGFEFVDQVKGGAIPNQFIPAVEKGVRQVLESGPIAGYPVHDVRVIVYDGKYHDVDSKEVAFIAAGKRAFMDAISKARAIVLEPIVNIEITAPEANMGDIAGDLSSKRGQLSGTDSLAPGTLVIKGQAPLSELGNYQARLKSVTAGQGSYTIEFARYEPVPPTVQKTLAEQHAKTAHAEEQ